MGEALPWPARPHGGFRTILADPPWRFEAYSEAGEEKNATAHYPCMDMDDLRKLPVEMLAAANSALFMWATFPMLPEALDLMGAWGFDYRSGGAWGKQSSTGNKLAFGTGYIFRSAAELLLVGVRGEPKWKSKSERNLWLAPIREHSRKPDLFHPMLERMALGPRLELFGRQRRPGWTVWGNDVEKFTPVDPGDVV